MIKQITLLSSLIFVISALLIVDSISENSNEPKPSASKSDKAVAVFAGGCFWCMESPFDKREGVVDTIVGYTAGHKENPTYPEVSSGSTGHTEAIQVFYDPSKVAYSELLDVFWRNIDPFDAKGQFCDKGMQYRSGIYYSSESEKQLAQESKEKLEKKFGQSIVTEIEPASKFYPAEDYHQDYYKKNPVRYRFYRYGCGRDKRLSQIWDE